MKIILNLLFIFTTTIMVAQKSTMKSGFNLIEREYKATEKQKKEIKEKSIEKDELSFYVKKKDGKFLIFLLNNSQTEIIIKNIDGQLYILQEAKDKNGNWKPIEYHNTSSWCGNSYKEDILEVNEVIKSKAFLYKGEFKTKIRFKLLYNKKIYYSNSVNGEINKSQFVAPKTIYPFEKKINDIVGKETFEKYIFLDPKASVIFNKKYMKYLQKRNK